MPVSISARPEPSMVKRDLNVGFGSVSLDMGLALGV